MARRGGVWLAALVGVVAAALWTQGMRGLGWAPDEEFFVQLARVAGENFPGSIVDVEELTVYSDRGVQRLLPLTLIVPLEVVNGWEGFALARAIIALAWTSAAVPAYLLARGVRLDAPWALLAAGLSVVVPWASLGTSLLTEPLAFPLAMWAMWAAWRACVVPGVASDVLALAFVGAAVFARTGSAVLAGVAPLAVLLARGRHMPREHPLLALVLAGGALLVAANAFGAGLLGGVFGSYNTAFADLGWSLLPEKFAIAFARLTTGVGIVPVLLGVPWLVAALGRRRAPEDRALALVCASGVLLVLFSTFYAAPEERYYAHAAPLLVLPGVVALARRQVTPWAVGLTALAVAVLVWRVPWPYVADAAPFQTDAARAFFSRVVLGGLGNVVSDAPLLAGVLVALGGAVLAVGLRRGGAQVALAVAVLLAGAQVVQAGYVVGKRAALTAPPVGLSERVWVDEEAGGEDVGLLVEGFAQGLEYLPEWREIAFYNRRMDERLGTDEQPGSPLPYSSVYRPLELDPRTGAMIPADGRPVPALHVVPTRFREIVLDGERPVRTSKYLSAQLLRIRRPLRALARWRGADPDGTLLVDQGARLQLFPAARDAACATVTLAAAPDAGDDHRVTFTGGRRPVRRTVRPGATETVAVPLERGTRRLDVRATTATGEGAGVVVTRTAVGACPSGGTPGGR